MIGERVRHARIYYGWTQAQLAALVGISQPAIHQIEATGQVSSLTLNEIAGATGFSPWWFELGPLPDLPQGSLRYRKYASATRRDDERVRAYARHTVEAVERLSQDANLPPVRVAPIGRDEQVDQDGIEALVGDTREWLGVGSADPIPHLVRAVERSGVVILGFALELERHDAVSFWADFPSGRPFVFFSRGYSGDRQRFSIAHELGHLVLHQIRTTEGKVAEKEAHAFAGALLFPRAAAAEIQEPVTLRSLAFLKAKWGISVRALIKRTLDLGLISEARRVSLEKQYSSRKWHREEPVTVAEEQPLLVSKLVKVTLGSRTSATSVARTLGLPSMSTRELVA